MEHEVRPVSICWVGRTTAHVPPPVASIRFTLSRSSTHHVDLTDLPLAPVPFFPDDTLSPPKNLVDLSRWTKVILLPLANESDLKLAIKLSPTFPFLLRTVVFDGLGSTASNAGLVVGRLMTWIVSLSSSSSSLFSSSW